MDRRWPWKKKSSDKTVLEKAAAALDSVAVDSGVSSQGSQVYIYKFENICLQRISH